MKAAWLLVALGRYDEAFDAARVAQEQWRVNRRNNPSPYGGNTYWEPWRLEAAVHLGNQNWTEASRCAVRVLDDFPEDVKAGWLFDLAEHASGKLVPPLAPLVCKDPDAELAAFDLRDFALTSAGLRPSDSG